MGKNATNTYMISGELLSDLMQYFMFPEDLSSNELDELKSKIADEVRKKCEKVIISSLYHDAVFGSESIKIREEKLSRYYDLKGIPPKNRKSLTSLIADFRR